MVLRVTRQDAEVLLFTPDGQLRVSKQAVEALYASDAGKLRVSKQQVEALVPLVADIPASGSNNIAFAQVASAVATKDQSVNSAIALTQNVVFVHVKTFTESASSTLNFAQDVAWLGPHYLSALAKVNFNQTVNAYQGTPWGPVVIEDIISFTHIAPLTRDAAANNALSLTHEAYRSQTPFSTLGITDSLESGKAKPVDTSDLNLSQTIAMSNEFVRVMSDTNFIGHSLTYYVESPCSTKQYTPFVGENTIPGSPTPPETTEPLVQADPTVTRFQLSYPALATPTDVVVLRAPELDNIDRLAFTRIARETRGGQLSVFADPDWPKTETIIATFVGLTKTEIDDLQAFFVSHIGEEVGMQDWEGREWVGVVTTPNEAAVNDGGRNACGGKGWTITFEFEGVLVDGHAPNDLMEFVQTVNTVLVSP